MAIYEFTIKETSKATIPVRAESKQAAWKIFNDWYEDGIGREETEIRDLLDEGYEGCEVRVGLPKVELSYPPEDIYLPKEKDQPTDQLWSMHISFEDGSSPWILYNVSFGRVIEEYQRWSKQFLMTQYVTKDYDKGPMFFFQAREKNRYRDHPAKKTPPIMKEGE